MKNLTILGVFLIFFCSSLFIYAEENQRVNFQDLISKMTSELDLNDQQVTAIKPIIKESLKKRQDFLKSLESEPVINKAEVKATIRKFQNNQNEKLSQVLTEQQYKKWINKQRLRESLNRDKINYKEYLGEDIGLNAQGGSFKF